MNNLPKISILITHYNQLEYLERALDSATMQTYENLEIIVGDDCSTQHGAKELVDKCKDKRVRIVRNKANLGRRNQYRYLLFEVATGDYATILNADDYYVDKEYFSKVVNLFKKNKEVVLVFGKTQVNLEFQNKKIGDSIIDEMHEITDGNWLFLNQTKGFIIPHVSSVYNRSLAMELDFYRSYTISEDWESLYRIILGHKVGFIGEVSAMYGRHSNNISKDINLKTIFENLEYINTPYQHAIELNQISIKALDKWKEEMMYRYFVKVYIKIALWDPSNLMPFKNKLKQDFPQLALKMKYDYRVKAFNVLKYNHSLLRWVFGRYLKQESVIADFLQHAKSLNK